MLYNRILKRNLTEKQKLKVIPKNIRNWPSQYTLLQKILSSKSRISKFIILTRELQQFFPSNKFIKETVPLLFRDKWPTDRLERFIKDFKDGAVAPEGLDNFRLDGSQSWSLKSIEERIRELSNSIEYCTITENLLNTNFY